MLRVAQSSGKGGVVAIKSREAYEYHFVSRPEERTLAQSLGEAFDITYGDQSKGYSFWFADPHEHVCERFGLRDEVLVLYSAHDVIHRRFVHHSL